jgi:[CysO sulfur-carrier protein]-S-L-cysteine hydrolase
MLGSLRIASDLIAAMRAHGEETFPDECCGALLRDAEGSLSLRRWTNIQNQLHREDPAKHPRDARTAYYIDPQELLAVAREEAEAGVAIAALYHSHPDHAAYFSAEDRARAVIEDWDEPIYPDAAYIVLSVMGGKAGDIKAFVWDDDTREFIERKVEADQ